MMVMTAKVDIKKILIGLAAAAALIIALIALLGGGEQSAAATAGTLASNDARVAYLSKMGWEVSATPVESGQVTIPQEQSQIFSRYNELQKSQGYDLSKYAGKTVMRYVYQINNYPGATEPVYATVLVYKNQVIGGDVTDTGAKGKVQGFKMPQQISDPTTESTAEGTS